MTGSPWYYAQEGRPSEPVTADALRQLATAGSVTAETLVWQAGMEAWTPAAAVPGLLPAAASTSRDTQRSALYQDNSARAALASLFLIVIALVDVAAVLAAAFHLAVLGPAAAGQAVPQSVLDVHQLVEGLLALVQLVVLIASACAFIAWFRRAYANLAAFGVTPVHSLGWTAWGFIVPFINLVRPHAIAQEIWSGSRDGTDRGREGNRLITVWWGLFLLMNFVGQASGRLTFRADTLAAQRTATAVSLAADALSCAAAVAAVAVIRSLQRAQTARAARA